jgi:ABC-type sugar transport system permease subunit
MRRALAVILLVACLTILGFALALLAANELVYPGPREMGRGLARLSFALGGAFAGFAAGIVMGFVLKPARAIRVALIALLLAGITLSTIAWRAARERAPLIAPPGQRVDSSPGLLRYGWMRPEPMVPRRAG